MKPQLSALSQPEILHDPNPNSHIAVPLTWSKNPQVCRRSHVPQLRLPLSSAASVMFMAVWYDFRLDLLFFSPTGVAH